MYCDEFHQACVSSYHPQGCVVIPQNLMKGDASCRFTFVIPPQKEDIDFGPMTELGRKLSGYYVARTRNEGAVQALRRGVRLHGGRYFTLGRELCSTFGAEGQEVLRIGLRRWAEERGHMLRNEHESLSMERKAYTLFNHFDLPYPFLWNTREKKKGKKSVLEIKYCAFADVWKDFDGLDIGYIYCQETYPVLVQSYGLNSFHLIHCLCKGDRKCTFEIT